MSVVAVISRRSDEWDDTYDYVRDTQRKYGMSFPTGFAGIVVNDCDVLCHECATKDEYERGSIIFGDSEWDYPGYPCDECRKYLDVDLLIYDDGPGSEILEDLPDWAFL